MSFSSSMNHIPVLPVTDQYKLRAMRLTDAHDYYAYSHDPDVGKYVLVDRLESEQAAFEEIKYRAELFRYQQGVFWAVVDCATDEMVGWVGYYLKPSLLRGELAYELAKPLWGQGIMTSVIQTVVRYAFSFMSLIRVEAIIMKENTASERLLLRNGFIHEGTLHAYKYYNQVPYNVELYAHTAAWYKENSSSS